jgi:hypothetical protein
MWRQRRVVAYETATTAFAMDEIAHEARRQAEPLNPLLKGHPDCCRADRIYLATTEKEAARPVSPRVLLAFLQRHRRCKMSDKGPSPAQLKAIETLVAGKSVMEAATASEVDRTTVHRWLKDDVVFQVALNTAQRELRDAMQTRLLALADKAVDAIEQSIKEGDGKAALALLRGLGLLSGGPHNRSR